MVLQLELVEDMLRKISAKVGREVKGYYSLADMGGLGMGMVSLLKRVEGGQAGSLVWFV